MGAKKKTKPGGWAIVAGILATIGPIATPIAVCVVGANLKAGIATAQRKDAEAAEDRRAKASSDARALQRKEANLRLYTELMTKREEAESRLRKDMFVNYIQAFLAQQAACPQCTPGERIEMLEGMTLKLELLAENFHESINLKSLFIYLMAEVQKLKADPLVSPKTKRDRVILERRLQKVARNAAKKQAWVLKTEDAFIQRRIDLTENPTSGLRNPTDERVLLTGTHREMLESHTHGEGYEEARRDHSDMLVLDGIRRWFTITAEWLEEPDATGDQIELEVVIEEERSNGNGESRRLTRPISFTLSPFDFPMVDNIRLSKDHRVAVVLTDYEPNQFAEIEVIVFPGRLASMRMKPYFHHIIEELDHIKAPEPGPGDPEPAGE